MENMSVSSTEPDELSTSLMEFVSNFNSVNDSYEKFYEDLLKKNAQLEDKIKKLGLEGLKNYPKLKECSEFLQEWQVGEVNKTSILTACTAYYRKNAEDFMKYSALKHEENRLDNKINQVKALENSVDSSNTLFKATLKKQLEEATKNYYPRESIITVPEPNSLEPLPHESLIELMDELKKKKEKLASIQKQKIKYMDLPPDLKAAKEKLREAKLTLERKTASLDELVNKYYSR